MRESLMDIIVCPVCKGTLELSIKEKEKDEIVSGSLFCSRCNFNYPIKDSIPNLLPPEMQS
ncbi:MAG: methytransferase partner Trm112 [Dehalococcoidia bacterium]|nr:methytransferase partner Trm112 [Dehalococcoidia bacterium]MDD5495214.1 methytransferase partner Trm112 [Dehalococcoidia bacterium]